MREPFTARDPVTSLTDRLMQIARRGAEQHRNKVYDVYDLLALDIMSITTVEQHTAARAQIAALLRMTHKDGPAAALRSQMP